MFSFLTHIKSLKVFIILKNLFPYFWATDKKVRFKLFLSIIFNILAILATLVTPILFAYAIDTFNSSHSLSFSWFLLLLGAYVSAWSLGKIFIYLREILMFPVMERATHSLAFHLFQHVQLLPFQYHLKRKTGEVTSIIETAIQSFPPIVWAVTFALGPLIIESFCVLGIVGLICGVSYSLILAISLILYAIITHLGFMKALRSVRKANYSHVMTTSKIVDSFLNFSSTKYFHTYDFEFQKINQALQARENIITKALIKDQMIRIYQTFTLFCSFFTLMIFTGYNLMHNTLSLGEFIMIHTYMLQFTIPLESFGQTFQILNQSFVKMEKALKTFKKPLEVRSGQIRLNKNQPLHIIFEDVWFGYEKKSPLLKGITFELYPNQTLAIVGATGSGKSTIISLLLGFLEPWQGRILVNGYELKNIDQESLINSIGIVPQHVTLFNDTIAHNIFYACMSASKKLLLNALIAANLNETMQKLPQGLETIVGEQGAQLSGGEKQRIGLARAIIRQPKLYIFDEATSSLDSKTEKKVMKNIENISHKASSIIIAHRLSTVAFADQIILLENGVIKNKNYSSLIEKAQTAII